MYRAFTFYDSRGRRLAIFGEHTITGKIRISIITCSKDDNFSKKKAVRLYEQNIYPGEPNEVCTIENMVIPIEDPLKPGKSFHNFLNKNFWRRRQRVLRVNSEVLVPPQGSNRRIKVVKMSKPLLKMGYR